MRQTLRLGSIAGVPVGVHWSVLVIMALVVVLLGDSVLPTMAPGGSATTYWLVAAPGAVVFLASLLAHELAHALVARRRGVRVRSITLWMLGGVTHLEGEAPSPRTELEIAVAGPLTSVAAGVALLAAAWGLDTVGAPAAVVMAVLWIGVMNAFLGAFNLLPGAPLDGGRVLRAVLWRIHGDRARADRIATRAGKATGAVMIGLGVLEVLALGRLDGLWLVLLGWFLVQSAGAEQRTGIIRAASRGIVARDVMTPHPDTAPAWDSVRTFAEKVATRSRQTVFPVVGFDGGPRGVVTLDLLARVPADHADERLDTIAVALPAEYVVPPDAPLFSLLDRTALAGVLIAVVTDHGAAGDMIIGMITVDDLQRLVQLRHLQRIDRPVPAPNTPG